MPVSKRFERLPLPAQQEILRRRGARVKKRAVSELRETILKATRERSSADYLLSRGIGAVKLKEMGWGVSTLQEHLNPKDLIRLGFTDKKDYLDRSCGFQALNYRGAGLAARDLVKLLGFTAEELRRRYFSEEEIKDALK